MPTCCHLLSRLLMMLSNSASAAYSSFHTLTVPEQKTCMASAPYILVTVPYRCASSMTSLWQAVLMIGMQRGIIPHVLIREEDSALPCHTQRCLGATR